MNNRIQNLYRNFPIKILLSFFFIAAFATISYGQGTCPTCDGSVITVDVSTTVDFNPATPTCIGDADLCAIFTADKSGGATADKWKAVFDAGAKKLLVTSGTTITVSMVGSGNNQYAPGIEIWSTCELEVEAGGHIVVQSLNRNAGDIFIQVDGDITVDGEVRNEVTGTNGNPGNITVTSCCGNITVGSTGLIWDEGVDPGGKKITLLTCCEGDEGDITIDGLVLARAHAHADNLEETRPHIRVMAIGAVTINANSTEPFWDEHSYAGARYDIWPGLLSWVRDNNAPGSVKVQAGNDITVNGHGADPTGVVRTSFAAVAVTAGSSTPQGGTVDVRSLEGSIIGNNRAFEVARDGGASVIRLWADQDITLSRPGNSTCNPVVDNDGGTNGGTNELRAYQGGITVNSGALVTALGSVPANDGTNNFTYCTAYTNNGTISPAPTTSNDCTILTPDGLYADCSDFNIVCLCEECVPPVTNFSGDPTSICEGASVTFTDLSTGNPTSWSWSFPGGTPSSSNLQTPPAVTYSSAGTYTVELTVSNNCGSDTETKTLYITVYPNPDCTITAPSGVCENTSGHTASVADAGVGATYTWTVSGDGTLVSTPPFTNSITWDATAYNTGNVTIQVQITDANNCVCSGSVIVTVKTKPTATASSNSPCEDGTIMLYGGPDNMDSYSWTGPGPWSSSVQNPTRPNATLAMSGTYRLTVTEAGCSSDEVTTNVTVNPNPDCTISASSAVCELSPGHTASVTAVPGATYTWTVTGDGTLVSTPPFSNTITWDATAYNTGSVTIQVQITDPNNCVCTGSVIVTVITDPTAVASSNSPCEGETIELYGGPDYMDGYSWTGPDGWTSGDQNPTRPNATLGMSGTYELIVTLAGCDNDTATTDVTVKPTPVATASNNSPIELGETIELYGGPDGMDSYFWTGPDGWTSNQQNPTRPNATLSMAGLYHLTVTLNGCPSDPGTGITFVRTDGCPPAVSWGDTCMDHDLILSAEDYLIGSSPQSGFADQDSYAVGFYNPKGVARLDSIFFQWYDPGTIDLWIYLGREGACPHCEPLGQGQSPLDSMLGQIDPGYFIGNWNWEKVEVDTCIEIPAKSCFYVVWKMKEGMSTPRILGDFGHPESYSWIYNAETGLWKCFPGYEYMVSVCLDYSAGCIELREHDITWDHPYRGEYPCVCDDYVVRAAFHNTCAEGAFVSAAFFEAPWGLFTIPPIGIEPYCEESTLIAGGGVDTLVCECEYHHHPDSHNWWARNIVIGWTRDITFCCEDPEPGWYLTRRCRMTIWPNGPWDKVPGRWGLRPIAIPVWNDTGLPMTIELFLEDVPDEWEVYMSETVLILEPFGTPGDRDTVYVSVWPDGPEPEGPVIIKVKAFKCNGEWGEVELEFLPYPEHFYLGPDGRSVQPVHVEDLRWSPRYPCENGPYDVWVTVVNDGSNSAYPKISFGLAPWGFFTPVFEEWEGQENGAVFDTVLWDFRQEIGGIGGLSSQIVAPYHSETPWFEYENLECNYYQQYVRNIVIDYPVIRRHCLTPGEEPGTWVWTVEDSTTEFLRDCEQWLWSKHRWVSAESTWAPVAIPIPVYNEEPYSDCITLWIEPGDIPLAWDYSFDETVFCLNPGEVGQSNLTVIPKGSEPPSDLPAHVIVHAAKGFCDRDTQVVDIKFMPFTGMCIRDTSGVKVTYKHSNCGGEGPTLMPGDEVDIGLMLDNEYPVSAVQINLIFDAQYLSVVNVAKTARTAGFELIWRPSPGGGLMEIGLYSTPEHPHIDVLLPGEGYCEMPPGYEEEGNLSILTVTFEVLPGAPAGTCADIMYSNVILDGLDDWNDPPEPKEPLCLKFEDKGQICFGGYLVPGKCDLTGQQQAPDTMVTLLDLFAILNHMIGKQNPPLTGPVTLPGSQLWAADANGDALVNIIDLMKCINLAMGFCDPKVTVTDVEVGDVVGLAGRRVAVPVSVSTEKDMAGLLLRFRYDGNALEAGAPELTDRAEGMDVSFRVIGDELVVFVSSMTGAVIEAGTGSVVRVPFEVTGDGGDETEVEVMEPVVFTVDERVSFGHGCIFLVKAEELVPVGYSLAQNYPNPFNPVTSIEFGLPEDARVKVTVYNILGQVVTELVHDDLEAGYHVVQWAGENAASGIYFYRIQANDFTKTKRMVLMK